MLQHFVPLMSEGSCHSCHSASNFAEIKAHALARSLWCIPLPLLQKAKTILLLCPVRIGLLCKKHAVKQDLSYTPGNCARMCNWHHQCYIHSGHFAALQDKYNGLSFNMFTHLALVLECVIGIISAASTLIVWLHCRTSTTG